MRTFRSSAVVEYHPDLMTRVSAPSRRRRRLSFWTIGALVLLALCVALGLWSFSLLAAAKAPVIRMAEGLAGGLIAGDLYGTAERYMSDSLPLDARRAELARLREGLDAAGIDWSETRPLGFGGSLAGVLDGSQTVQASIGWLYLEVGPEIYAIELSASQGPDGFRVTHLWKWEKVSGPIESHAQKAYEKFSREPDGDVTTPILDPRYIFERF